MSCAPIGWSSGKMNLHFKPVLPTDSGMFSIMHKSAKRYSPKELREDIRNVDIARRILHRQRMSVKLFAGHRRPAKDEILDVSQRLYKDSRECLLRKSLNHLPPVTQAHYATDDVRDVVDRLSTYDPEKIPESKGQVVKLPTPIVYKKKYTEEEVRDIVKRLAQYDPKKWPAESRGGAPNVVSQIPRQTMARVKKCSADEVQEIVDRLYTFDDPKSESRGKTAISLPARGNTWI